MILLIYPKDPTIKRIEQHGNRVAKALTDVSSKFIIYPNEESKRLIHQEMIRGEEDDLIVFMGHGRSTALFGARGKYYNREEDVDYRVLQENPEFLYNDENFIDSSTYHLFKNKNVVLFACVSNELGPLLISSGAKGVLGFGKLPTTVTEFQDDWQFVKVNRHAVAALSGIIDVSFERAFIRVAKNNGNLVDLVYCIKNEIHWHISMLLYSRARYRYVLADILYAIEKSIVVFGKSDIPLIRESNHDAR